MELRDASIAVTGATGFLGRYVVDALLGRGAKVIGVVRSPDRVPALAARGVEMRRADLASVDDLTAGFRGADAVVSNAALFSIRNQSWDDHLRANVGGTRNVFRAVAAAGVRRVIQVSSVAVYRGAGSAAVDEDHPQHGEDSPRRPWTVYPISKALSEQLAWKLANDNALELTAVRPCAIYGAHDPNLMPVLKWPRERRARLAEPAAGRGLTRDDRARRQTGSDNFSFNVNDDRIEKWSDPVFAVFVSAARARRASSGRARSARRARRPRTS